MVNERELAVIKALTEAKGPSGLRTKRLPPRAKAYRTFAILKRTAFAIFIYTGVRTRAISPYSCLTRTATRWAS